MQTGAWIALLIVLCLVFLILGTVLGYLIRVKHHEKSFLKTKQEAEQIIASAEAEAEKKKKTIFIGCQTRNC